MRGKQEEKPQGYDLDSRDSGSNVGHTLDRHRHTTPLNESSYHHHPWKPTTPNEFDRSQIQWAEFVESGKHLQQDDEEAYERVLTIINDLGRAYAVTPEIRIRSEGNTDNGTDNCATVTGSPSKHLAQMPLSLSEMSSPQTQEPVSRNCTLGSVGALDDFENASDRPVQTMNPKSASTVNLDNDDICHEDSYILKNQRWIGLAQPSLSPQAECMTTPRLPAASRVHQQLPGSESSLRRLFGALTTGYRHAE